jgi:hypothetical protein
MDHRAWEFLVFAENLKKAHAAAPGVSAGTKRLIGATSFSSTTENIADIEQQGVHERET